MKAIPTNYYQPLKSHDEWRNLLSHPINHWVDGKSAKELVKLWLQTNDIPASVRSIFPDSDIKPLFIFPEYQVQMPGKGGNSQNDLYIYASTKTNNWVIIVEAKANEVFDETVEKWYEEKKNANGGENAAYRLTEIQKILELKVIDNPPYNTIGKLRTQLFHRTASAIIEAKRVEVSKALVLIQSFANNSNNYLDFKSFLSLFCIDNTIEKDKLIGPVKIGNIELHFAWINYTVEQAK
ncbi:MAG: hypothetical protein PHY48_10325 [Candidatus Cloacimonetes bacterium]|nr:hypothetical protein [Candidatus Cloacimonadota bacterium]